jgi:LemA protein
MEWVVPAVLVVVFLWGSVIYRRLAGLRREAVAAWPPLEAKLRQRHEVISHLVQALQALPAKQQKPVQALLKARNAAIVADLSPAAAGDAEWNLGVAIQRALALTAGHPQLQADPRLLRLAPLLDRLEREIAEAGAGFNQAALAFNQASFRAPGIFVAKLMNLHAVEYFALGQEERKALEAMRWDGMAKAP